MTPGFLIVMGVCGTGKSTVGRLAASRLGWTFLEGDAFHPPASIAKMESGTPLDDDDRAPWLASLHDEIARLRADGVNAVLACSALRERYRARLRGEFDDVAFLFLHGDPDLIAARMTARRDHYMRPALLDSQLAALEAPVDAIQADIADPPRTIVDAALANLGLGERC